MGEEELPELIHRNPGGEWMLVRKKPVREGESVCGRVGREGGKGGRSSWLDLFVFLRRVVHSAVENVGLSHLLGRIVPHNHGGDFSAEEFLFFLLGLEAGGLSIEEIAILSEDIPLEDFILNRVAFRGDRFHSIAHDVGHGPGNLFWIQDSVVVLKVVNLRLDLAAAGPSSEAEGNVIRDRPADLFGLDGCFHLLPVDVDGHTI